MSLDRVTLDAALVASRQTEEDESEEWCPFPAIGQLPLETIINAGGNGELDRIFRIRYPQLSTKEIKNPLHMLSGKHIRPLKRVALAKLEGFDNHTIAAHAKELKIPWKTAGSIKSMLSQYLNASYTKQIRENADSRIRMSALQSDPAIRKMVSKIIALTTIPLEHLFIALPPYKSEHRADTMVNLYCVVRAYLERWRGTTIKTTVKKLSEDVAANPNKLALTSEAMYQAMKRSFSEEAMRQIQLA